MSRNLNASLSVDCVVFGLDTNEHTLKILVYERSIFLNNISGNRNLKFPGNLVAENEGIDESAYRTLKEITGIQNANLTQFYSFGNPDRIKYDEEKDWAEKHYAVKINRVVTIAYYALIRIDNQNSDQKLIKDKLRWISVNNAENLAFDHSRILSKARKALQQDLILQNVMAYELLPSKFTLNQLQSMYEIILDKKLDKRNFRKKIEKINYIEPLGEKQNGVAHKPAMLYCFNENTFKKNREEIKSFFI